MNMYERSQRGAVSLFIVIFSALLIITIVTAFVRIMLQDQQQATSSDLAKSAMDSAYAGVEDTKRALVEYYKKGCSSNTSGRCAQLRGALLDNIDANGWTPYCDTTQRAGVAPVGDSSEVKVESDTRDAALDQAYTCVKVQMNPENYVGNSISQFIKLKSKDDAPFNQIKVEWYVQQDDEQLDLDDGVGDYALLDIWPTKRPQVLRLQLLQYGPSFSLTDFDNNTENNSSLFLLPTSMVGVTGTFSSNTRKVAGKGSMQNAGCERTPAKGSYACSITLSLPSLDPADPVRNAYLKVDQLYASGNKKFSLTLLNEDAATGVTSTVRLSDVQVVVDTTGRANDMFKRIQSRVDIGGGIPTPDAAVDVTRSFCKEFMITDTVAYPGAHTTECPRLPGS